MSGASIIWPVSCCCILLLVDVVLESALEPTARRRMAANEVVFIVRALRPAVKGGATMLLGCVALVPAVHSIF